MYDAFPQPDKLKHLGQPSVNTGAGVHLSGDAGGYGEDSIRLLYDHHFRWATLLNQGNELGAQPGGWVRSETIQLLLKYGIMPISRLYSDNGYDSVTPDRIARLTYSLRKNFAEAGYPDIPPYVQIGNEYNLVDEWGANKGAIDPVKAAEKWYASALAVLASGGIPLTTPCSPGGNYNDWAYFVAFLRRVKELAASYPGGYKAFFSKIAIAVHNYTDNKPLDWGKPDAWNVMAAPYRKWAKRNPFAPDYDPTFFTPGYEDSQGFCMFAWYHDYAYELTGVDIPVLSTEGGCSIGDGNITFRPKIDAGLHASYITSQMALMQGDTVTDTQVVNKAWTGGVPAYYFCTSFWTWGVQPGWYVSDIRGRPDTLKRIEGMTAHQRTQLSGIGTIPQPIPIPEPTPNPVPLAKLQYVYKGQEAGYVRGNLPAGSIVDLEFFGNHVRVKAGSKPEYGAGGFEALVATSTGYTCTVSVEGCEPLKVPMNGQVPFITVAGDASNTVPPPVKHEWQLKFAADVLTLRGTPNDPGDAIEDIQTVLGDSVNYVQRQRGTKRTLFYFSGDKTTYVSM